MVAILAAEKEKDLFDKVVLSAAGIEVNPSGPLIVS